MFMIIITYWVLLFIYKKGTRYNGEGYHIVCKSHIVYNIYYKLRKSYTVFKFESIIVYYLHEGIR